VIISGLQYSPTKNGINYTLGVTALNVLDGQGKYNLVGLMADIFPFTPVDPLLMH